METSLKIIVNKLIAKDKSVQRDALEAIGDIKKSQKLATLLEYLQKNNIGNGFAQTIKALGDFNNTIAVAPLIDCYGNANHHYRRLILKSLLQLGAFDQATKGITTSDIREGKIWAMVFGYSSKQLKDSLQLKPQDFHQQLDLAWQTTKHWRN